MEFEKMRLRFFVSLIVLISTYILIVAFRERAIDMLKDIPENFKNLVEERFLKRITEDSKFYAVSQWNMKNFAQMIPIVSIVIGFPLFSREVEKGTIYFILSNRTRRGVFFEKITAGIVSTALLSFTAILPIFNGVDPKVMLVYTIHSMVFAILWFSIAAFFSTIFDDQVKPLITSLAILGGLAVLETLKKIHLFEYVASPRIFDGGSIDICATLRLSMAIVVLIFLSYYNFKTSEF